MAHRSCALLTIVRDEPVFFPIWQRYYARFFRPGDMYVLDHGSTDGSTGGRGFVRIPVEHPTVDVVWVRDVVQSHQHELLRRYDAVLYVDVDEIVTPDPRRGSLRDYIDDFSGKIARCQGFELIHTPETEAPFDPGRPVLEQRFHWFANPMYSKPSLARVPLQWTPGFHSCRGLTQDPDPNLYLIHLHRMDYELCRARHRLRASVAWSERDLKHGWWNQMLIGDEPEFGKWFFTETVSDGDLPLVIEGVPEPFQGLI